MLVNEDYEFTGEEPTHIDRQILIALSIEADEASGDREEEYCLESTGETLDALMNKSLEVVMDLIKSFGPEKAVEQVALIMGVGDPLVYMPYYMVAWVAGMAKGLEKVRGLDMPSAGMDTGERFWDLDGTSVAYTAHERGHAAATSEELEEVTNSKPLILMGSCYIDGYVMGCRFDSKKNPHIEGRSVLL
jgi:hypothetical protein